MYCRLNRKIDGGSLWNTETVRFLHYIAETTFSRSRWSATEDVSKAANYGRIAINGPSTDAAHFSFGSRRRRWRWGWASGSVSSNFRRLLFGLLAARDGLERVILGYMEPLTKWLNLTTEVELSKQTCIYVRFRQNFPFVFHSLTQHIPFERTAWGRVGVAGRSGSRTMRS